MDVIQLNDKVQKCPKCGTTWVGDCFSTHLEGDFLPKCGMCGYVFKKTKTS